MFNEEILRCIFLGTFALSVIGGIILGMKFSGMTLKKFHNTFILLSTISVSYGIINHILKILFNSRIFTDNILFQVFTDYDSIITITCSIIGSVFVTIAILLRYGSYLVYFKSDKVKINRN